MKKIGKKSVKKLLIILTYNKDYTKKKQQTLKVKQTENKQPKHRENNTSTCRQP